MSIVLAPSVASAVTPVIVLKYFVRVVVAEGPAIASVCTLSSASVPVTVMVLPASDPPEVNVKVVWCPIPSAGAPGGKVPFRVVQGVRLIAPVTDSMNPLESAATNV
jgi:hypothetical protein